MRYFYFTSISFIRKNKRCYFRSIKPSLFSRMIRPAAPASCLKACVICYAFFCICLAYSTAGAQSFSKRENYQWVHMGTSGISFGMDFNASPPQEFTAAQIGAVASDLSGTASIADKDGNLLFYSDGNIIWDRNHNIMPNGWDINNDGSPEAGNYLYGWNLSNYTGGSIISSFNYDGVAIIPMPGNSHKYYVFTIADTLDEHQTASSGLAYGYTYALLSWEGKLRYCVVDMDLNNGLGAVDTAQRAIVISDSMSGNLQVVTGDNCNYWLVGFGYDGAYHAFNITAAGIDTTPVISALSPPLSPICYQLNISPDRTKLVQALGSEAQVCDFDPATGIVSNDVLIGTQGCFGSAFSPNSSKLYLDGVIGVRQYDLSEPGWPWTLLTINNITAIEIDRPLRLGPDGIIYGRYYTTNPYGVSYGLRIQYPDLAGAACQMDTFSNAPLMLRATIPDWQFPNEVAVLSYDTTSAVIYAPLCFSADSTVLHIDNITGTDFHWKKNTIGPNFYPVSNDTASYIADEPGRYTVTYFTADPCLYHKDTFIVKRVFFSLNLKDELSCDGAPVLLSPDADNGVQFLWQDSSTGASYQADTSGRYWVRATRDGCAVTDSAEVSIMDLRQDLDGRDTTLCMEDKTPVELNARVPQGATALWSTGETTARIQAGDTGIYWVEVRDSTCMIRDSVIIHKEYCECPFLMPNVFSPNNDGVNDTYGPSLPGSCPVSGLKMQVYNRWGQMVFVTYDAAKGWDGTYNGRHADGGVYYYTVRMWLGSNRTEVEKRGEFLLIR